MTVQDAKKIRDILLTPENALIVLIDFYSDWLDKNKYQGEYDKMQAEMWQMEYRLEKLRNEGRIADL